MVEYTEGCPPAKNEQPNEPKAANRQDSGAGQAKNPYAIIWKDGMELELY